MDSNLLTNSKNIVTSNFHSHPDKLTVMYPIELYTIPTYIFHAPGIA